MGVWADVWAEEWVDGVMYGWVCCKTKGFIKTKSLGVMGLRVGFININDM